MFEDDDFFIDNDELAADEQLDIVDSTILKLTEQLKKTSEELALNIKLKEGSDADASLSIIAGLVNQIITLKSIDIENLSDEEIEEAINSAIKSTTELTFNNINNVLGDDEPTDITTTDDSDDDNSSLDF